MRLIDADTLNDYVMDIWGRGNTDNTVIWYGDVLVAINDAPTIDAVPVVQGSPCDLCRYAPPSSFDGKPCAMCPASAKIWGNTDGSE